MSLVAAAALSTAACGGRTQLIPAYQIGRLSTDAVVARASDVRVVVRTDAWPGEALDDARVLAVELTFDNDSLRALRVRGQDVALVTPEGERIGSLSLADLPITTPAADVLAARALTDRAVGPGERISGFLYFPGPPTADSLQLRIDLIDAASGRAFGLIEIPFYVD